MKICLVCKYPPIQGGVSTQCYWAARGLASRGHQVHVVTNANEVESAFRIDLDEADLGPQGDYSRRFPDTGGFVQVHSTEPPDTGRLYYIPLGNPTVSRLATLATDVIRREGCEVMFSYYLEPYGVAAHLASGWTGVPFIFKHAGSDLYRLLPLEELRTGYLEVLARANRILSRGASLRELVSLGLDETRFASNVVFRVPLDHFHPDAEPLDLDRLAGKHGRAPLDPARPVLGVYGKIGEYKGSFDLLRAMARLAREDAAPNLVLVGGGWQQERFLRLGRELGIDHHLRFLPFIPHWRIPAFIRACDALAFLERDFPIGAHSPGIPEEILACGKCLVVSEEVARKQIRRYAIRDRRNVVVVSDPRNADELADGLRFALEDRDRAAEIGRRGREELLGEPGTQDWVGAIEQLLAEVAGEPLAPRRLVPPSQAQPPGGSLRDPVELFERFFPYTASLADARYHQALRATVATTSIGATDDHGTLLHDLGEASAAAFREMGETGSLASEILRFERRKHAWTGRRPPEDLATLGNGDFDAPVKILGDWELLEFDFDLEAALTAIDQGQPVDPARRRTLVLLRLGSLPLWISGATEVLLRRLSEGSLPVGRLVEEMADAFGGSEDQRRCTIGSCLEVLEAMHWEGLLRLPEGWCASAHLPTSSTALEGSP